LNFNPTERNSSSRRGEAEAKISRPDKEIGIDFAFYNMNIVIFITNKLLTVNWKLYLLLDGLGAIISP